MSNWTELIARGTRADQPAAASVGAGPLYCVTDEGNIVEQSNGSAWVAYSPTAAALISDTAYDATSWNAVTGVAPSKNAVRDKIEALPGELISDTAYDESTWNAVTSVAPSKNAVRDKIESLAATIPTVSDTAYDATSWDGVTTIAPSKNAVRDKFEGLPATLISDTAYDASSWNGVTNVAPSKNAVRDKMETVATAAHAFDLVFSLSGLPASATTFPWITFTRAVSFLANWSGSYGTVGTNPTATATFTVKKNGSTVGTIEVSTGGTVTFATSGGSAVSFAAGDRATLVSPTQDATLADIAFTLAGTK